MRIWYLPLENYKERYTELLRGWTLSRFESLGLACEVVDGSDPGSGSIGVGAVLDAHGRCRWALTQTAELVRRLPEAESGDSIYIEDMFHPGYEALPYVLAQTGQRPRIVVRNHAQTVDGHDFTTRLGMRRWMRHFELMVDRTVTTIVCGAECHVEEMRNGGYTGDVRVLGLPFDANDVRARAAAAGRPRGQFDVVFSSRLDQEKLPRLMVGIAGRLAQSGFTVAVCTGSASVRSSDPNLAALVEAAEQSGHLTVLRSCTKSDYYGTLAGSRLHLNTSLQDYVSYGVLEASALGVPSLCPAYKSFPEVMRNDRRRLYVPWSIDDAVEKAVAILDGSARIRPDEVAEPAATHHASLDRIADLLKGSE